jgi:hypothetical protein
MIKTKHKLIIHDNSDNRVESWIPIKEYEDQYDISSHGRIRRKFFNGKKQIRTLKPCSLHVSVMLRKYSTAKTKQLHILFAQHFIPNPNNYKHVRAKDGDLKNISTINLFWSKDFLKEWSHPKEDEIIRLFMELDEPKKIAEFLNIHIWDVEKCLTKFLSQRTFNQFNASVDEFDIDVDSSLLDSNYLNFIANSTTVGEVAY